MKQKSYLGIALFRSVKSRLILAFAIILLVPSTAIGVISYNTAKGKVEDQIEQAAFANVDLLNQMITQLIERQMRDVGLLAQEIDGGSLDSASSAKREDIQQQLDRYMKQHPELEGIILGTDSGSYIFSPKSVPLPPDYDPRIRPWYTIAKEDTDKVLLTDPYIMQGTNEPVVSIVKVTRDGKGVLAPTLSLKELSATIKKVNIGYQGFPVLIDAKGKVLVHPTMKIGTDTPEDLVPALTASDSGKFDYIGPVDGKAKTMIFTTNPVTKWKLLGTWYTEEIKRESAPIFTTTVTVILIAMLLGAGFVYLILRSLPSPSLERKYQILYELSPLAVLLLDGRARIREGNPAAMNLLQLSAQEIRQLEFPLLLPPDERDRFVKEIEYGLLNHKLNGREWTILKSSGHPRLVEIESEPFSMDGEQYQYLILRDITESRAAEDKVAYLAYHDGLTGLYNRIKFQELLSGALRQIREDKRQLAVLLMDLDRFKLINDTKGHHIGDLLLKHVASQLTMSAPEDAMIARLGGDEFVLLLPSVDNMEQVQLAARNLLRAFKEPFQHEDFSHYVTASLGICLAPQYGQNSDELLKNADIAMYAAKNSGKNRYMSFTPQLSVTNGSRLSIEAPLREAIANREFELHYQPIVNSDNGEIAEVEALIRWMRPGIGAVPPADFISLAEELGLIIPIGAWVLEQACMDMRRWAEMNLPVVKVSVNISPVEFKNRKFVSRLRSILEASQIDPGLLNLEITENTALENQEYSKEICSELLRLGVSLHIDDFGTGYSSFSLLKYVKFDAIKIDRSFVREIHHSSSDYEIVKAIIAMAHELELKVVAEGVEEAEQWNRLREIGCDLIQGYYVSKPFPAKELPGFISRWRT